MEVPETGADTEGVTRPAAAVAWRALPPLQRALGGSPAGVADAGFAGRLATWQSPALGAGRGPGVLDTSGDALPLFSVSR
ncbi:hypothetical protein G3I42_15865, partial [Streptomyces sp. SID11385]|nr:hypothetical protein [Streptomyces sp. SID11385]